MHLLSTLGEGDPYFYYFVVCWAINKKSRYGNSAYEANYFIFAFLTATLICYIFKPFFHMSRPYFDNLDLGDKKINDCSAEFGNPSGHSVLTAQTCTTLVLYYEQAYANLFQRKRDKCLKVLIRTCTFLFAAGVVFSRVYTGRHSFDQCLNGVMLGIWCACIGHYYWRPYCLDHSIFNTNTGREHNN